MRALSSVSIRQDVAVVFYRRNTVPGKKTQCSAEGQTCRVTHRYRTGSGNFMCAHDKSLGRRTYKGEGVTGD